MNQLPPEGKPVNLSRFVLALGGAFLSVFIIYSFSVLFSQRTSVFSERSQTTRPSVGQTGDAARTRPPLPVSPSLSHTGPPAVRQIGDMPRGTRPLVGSQDGFQQTRGNIWEGRGLYLKSDLTFIGTIRGVADDHVFDDGTVRDGVLVGFPDGSAMWIPRETVHLLYLTRRN